MVTIHNVPKPRVMAGARQRLPHRCPKRHRWRLSEEVTAALAGARETLCLDSPTQIQPVIRTIRVIRGKTLSSRLLGTTRVSLMYRESHESNE